MGLLYFFEGALLFGVEGLAEAEVEVDEIEFGALEADKTDVVEAETVSKCIKIMLKFASFQKLFCIDLAHDFVSTKHLKLRSLIASK